MSTTLTGRAAVLEHCRNHGHRTDDGELAGPCQHPGCTAYCLADMLRSLVDVDGERRVLCPSCGRRALQARRVVSSF